MLDADFMVHEWDGLKMPEKFRHWNSKSLLNIILVESGSIRGKAIMCMCPYFPFCIEPCS